MNGYRQFRLPRCWSNQELRRLAALFHGDIVNVSAGDDVDKQGATYAEYFVNKHDYYITNYAPGAFRGYKSRSNEIYLDLRAPLPPNLLHRFDVAFNHTTLEHVFEIHAAFATLCALSRDIVIVVVPFAQVQHENNAYEDFWRLTPTCLRRLFQDNGFTTVYESESPQVDASIYLLFVASRHPDKWVNVLPESTCLSSAGAWLGRSRSHGWITRLPRAILRAAFRHSR